MSLRAVLVLLVLVGCERSETLPPAAAEAAPLEAAGAPALEGTVATVHDGDTLSVRSGGQLIRVRLAQIDAPERGQPWGRRATQALARLAESRRARLAVVDRDDYGRSVADLYVGDVFVNEALVRQGHAWAYPRYVRNQLVLEAEQEARRERRGLWRLPPGERVPPWDWRRSHPRRARRAQ